MDNCRALLQLLFVQWFVIRAASLEPHVVLDNRIHGVPKTCSRRGDARFFPVEGRAVVWNSLVGRDILTHARKLGLTGQHDWVLAVTRTQFGESFLPSSSKSRFQTKRNDLRVVALRSLRLVTSRTLRLQASQWRIGPAVLILSHSFPSNSAAMQCYMQ